MRTHRQVAAVRPHRTRLASHWLHDVVVEERLPVPKGRTLPRCTAGARACPPEDCGGAPGYFELLEALHDVTHSEHESYREWVGSAFDPELTGVVIGTGIGGIGSIEEQSLIMISKGPKRVSPTLVPSAVPDVAANEVAIKYGLQGPSCAVCTAI